MKDYRCSHCDQMLCICGTEDYRCPVCHNGECSCRRVKGWSKLYCDDCQGQYGKCWCVGGDMRTEDSVVESNNETKETNPKDAIGIKKVPISTVSGPVLAEIALAMMEGALKYGRHNYRVSGVRASVYRDATFRHLNKWWEGQDVDVDSGIHHIIKAIAGLTVLYDAMIFDKLEDDRPPALPNAEEYWKSLDEKAAKLIEKCVKQVPAFTQKGLKNEKS